MAPVRSATAALPIASIGWRTVVNGGSVQFMKAESSNPTTDTSSGTVQPAPAHGADRAERERVAGAHDAGGTFGDQPVRGSLPTFKGKHRPLDEIRRRSTPEDLERLQLAT